MLHRRKLLQSTAALVAGPTAAMLASHSIAKATIPAPNAAAHALNRLGFGPRPGDLALVAKDPQAWIDQQLKPQSIALPVSLTTRLDEDKFTTGDPMHEC